MPRRRRRRSAFSDVDPAVLAVTSHLPSRCTQTLHKPFVIVARSSTMSTMRTDSAGRIRRRRRWQRAVRLGTERSRRSGRPLRGRGRAKHTRTPFDVVQTPAYLLRRSPLPGVVSPCIHRTEFGTQGCARHLARIENGSARSEKSSPTCTPSVLRQKDGLRTVPAGLRRFRRRGNSARLALPGAGVCVRRRSPPQVAPASPCMPSGSANVIRGRRSGWPCSRP
jgi:hypothetical protein